MFKDPRKALNDALSKDERLFDAEPGTQPTAFRFQINLNKALDIYSRCFEINKIDIVTYALIDYLKKDYDGLLYEPFDALVDVNKEGMDAFNKYRKEINSKDELATFIRSELKRIEKERKG